ncbi:MAG: acetyl-CoA carboxylase biotin carboxyl carrier protein subunit [Verrucomicrobiales bacterium]|jgi:biotin carboxyl carrier protein|nr:acetyl-CoA carboxylase biotin carboxyl carrier protein subunit [Verrucomicrobiales bacterium]
MSKKLRITVEGKTYEVLVEALDAPAAAPAPAAASSVVAAPVIAAAPKAAAPVVAGAAGDLTSPLAGKVVAVKVSVGQAVKAGEEVVIVEAMKMNTPVNAATDGKVEAVYVAAGAAVTEGQPLVKIG